MSQKTLGIIGGSGLYEIEGLTKVEKHKVDTPFGDPSDEYLSGTLEDTRLVFLPRHGLGHRFLPHEVNYRANIFGFKKLGVEWLLSSSAVGSLREEIVPGHMVIPDQFFDRTRSRISTFFGDGIVAHVPFGDPVCGRLKDIIVSASQKVGAKTHVNGTYVCMEGPQFSSRAESFYYRSLDASVIGMTNLPEAKLAREAEMSYATLAQATDYDCWHETEDDVEVHAVLETMRKNVATAKEIIKEVARNIPAEPSPFKGILKTSIMTNPVVMPKATKKKLELLIGDYVG